MNVLSEKEKFKALRKIRLYFISFRRFFCGGRRPTIYDVARLKWHCEHWIERLGRITMIILLLLGVSFFILIFFSIPNKALLKNQASEIRSRLAMPQQPAIQMRENLSDVHSDEINISLEKNKSLIAFEFIDSGIIVHEASYKIEEVVKGKLQKLYLDFALRGHYPVLVNTIDKLQGKYSFLRLESLFIERPTPDDPLPQIRLKLSILGHK